MDKKKILIVEDDQMICSMYKTKFEADGFACLVANDGPAGLETAKKEKPNLIMLDVMLPQLDGFSILKDLKADSKTKGIPVIMLTNLGTDEDKKKGETLGAADYWVKASLTPAEISKKIKEHLK
ncbi:MAG: response regulator [Patescibacteria group bacterium]|nr:response regulator [Patescibacteria group bacterium]MDD5295124.1 response regulator [Patescibacteria group bacterium]MDD5554066.1 response regulator [Patescibacteria group bacterium]